MVFLGAYRALKHQQPKGQKRAVTAPKGATTSCPIAAIAHSSPLALSALRGIMEAETDDDQNSVFFSGDELKSINHVERVVRKHWRTTRAWPSNAPNDWY